MKPRLLLAFLISTALILPSKIVLRLETVDASPVAVPEMSADRHCDHTSLETEVSSEDNKAGCCRSEGREKLPDNPQHYRNLAAKTACAPSASSFVEFTTTPVPVHRTAAATRYRAPPSAC